MKNKTPLQHLPLLIPFMAGTFVCTGCIPPHMETPTATGDKRVTKQATPDKMHTLLEQPEIAVPAEEHQPPPHSPIPDPEGVCQVLTGCPTEEADKAAVQARKFEQQLLHPPVQRKPARKQRTPTSQSSQHPVTNSRKKIVEKTGQASASVSSPPLLPDNSNRLLAYVELGSKVFIQSGQDDSLQTMNTLLTDGATDNLALVQQFSAPLTLEMIQDATSHSIQALNYVGADFST